MPKNQEKIIVDNTKSFFEDLKKGEKTAVIVASAFMLNYPKEYKKVFSWLRNKGVRFVYDADFGADIMTYLYVKAIEEINLDLVIVQPCREVANDIEKCYPDLFQYLSPIGSSMYCAAVYLKEYDGFNGKVAALLPCSGKIDKSNKVKVVDYNITFTELMEAYQAEMIEFGESDFDLPESLIGFWYPLPGGLRKYVEEIFGKGIHIKKIEGPKLAQEYLQAVNKEKAKLPVLIDILSCSDGCCLGAESEERTVADKKDKQFFEKKITPKEIVKNFDQRLHMSHFVVDEIVSAILKVVDNNTEDLSVVNFGACRADELVNGSIKRLEDLIQAFGSKF